MAKVKGRIEPLTFNNYMVLAMAKGPSAPACMCSSIRARTVLCLVSALTLEASACASLAGTESVRFLHSTSSSVVLYLYTCDGTIKLIMQFVFIRYSAAFHESAEVGYTLDYMNFLENPPFLLRPLCTCQV